MLDTCGSRANYQLRKVCVLPEWPPTLKKEIELEIAHVLFLDIVGYSKLLIEEQKERIGQLTSIVLGTAQVRDSTDEQLGIRGVQTLPLCFHCHPY